MFSKGLTHQMTTREAAFGKVVGIPSPTPAKMMTSSLNENTKPKQFLAGKLGLSVTNRNCCLMRSLLILESLFRLLTERVGNVL